MFAVSADEVPPNIVILLDNGAEMQQVVWHPAYDNHIDFTPAGDGEDDDVVKNMGSGSGFLLNQSTVLLMICVCASGGSR